jgi:hypothetical protein
MKKDKKTLIKEYVDMVLTDSYLPLLESRDKDKKILFDNKEYEFGCPEHLEDLNKTIISLRSTLECFKRGSSTRMIISNTIRVLKGIIDKYKSTSDNESEKV